MQDDGSVDEAAFRRLVDWHIAEGTDAIVAVGTTGESATLDEDEHCAAIALVVEQAAGRIPVIAGTGANSTTEAIALTRCAKDAGADACLLVTPYYNKPTQEGLYRHYRAVAEAVDIDRSSTTCQAAPRSICCPRPLRGLRRSTTSLASRRRPATSRVSSSCAA
jgi:4-hydroxy-tetrahydrodipicolinate synthase